MNRPKGSLGLEEAVGKPPIHPHSSGMGGGGGGGSSGGSGQPLNTPGARRAGKIKVRRDSMKMIHAHLTQSPDASRPEDLEQINKIATDGLSIVVIGASGDLAKKKTYPALFELYLSEFLPKHTRVAGYARSDLSNEDLRKKLRPFLLEKTPGATEVHIS